MQMQLVKMNKCNESEYANAISQNELMHLYKMNIPLPENKKENINLFIYKKG